VKFRPRTVNASNVDGLLFRWEWNDAICAAARDFEQDLDEMFQRKGFNAAQIKSFTSPISHRSGNHQSAGNIVNIVKASKLLSVAEDLNFFAVDGLAYKPSGEALPRVTHELPRTESVDQPQ